MDVLIGMQWGDEGKGKIVDFLSPNYEVIARFQGGPNAGHTLEIGTQKHVLHQIPSGIFRNACQNVIGNGVVLDLTVLQREILALEQLQVPVRERLTISDKAQIILPTHKLLDQAQEASKGQNKIGSTLKGIGPTYQDKIGRAGMRMGEIKSKDFREKYEKQKAVHLAQLAHLNWSSEDLSALEEAFFQSVAFFQDFQIQSTEYSLNKAIKANQKILAEGAQGIMLDVDFGSYPFVTSSNTIVAGACSGLGIAPREVKNVFGIFKAYCTRVGSGPFPTELFDQTGEEIAKNGREFGSTTGRKRRCGWLDLPALKYACMLNGTTHLFMMKADVLSNLPEIKICTQYRLEDGTYTDQIPFDMPNCAISPIYKTFKGWQKNIDNISDYQQLPQELTAFIDFIEAYIGLPISIVSTGPNRNATIVREFINLTTN